ncbi:MAG: 50S ribosomal protein L5 [Candidatus Peribacteraceae bacterium]|jgi:large subunit ribosomal protein L5|nr:50S ribosomal protein L5 [bacterium]MDP6561762.1 50S ribosomal protein L5 [Candidatus Peribacteraceae bacterium]|tara:strand:- start:7694 stop:8404 length:711 start_codon:yes stop_codon:yes gene_type:complete
MAYATLHDRLRGPIATKVGKQLGVKNALALPQVEKVTVNVGINKSKMDSKEMHAYIEESLMKITGQKPVFTKARIAISNFKTREGNVVGCRVTLRGKRMEEFLDGLLSYAIPRIRDFRGLPSKLDGQGNYSIGIRDHSIFPEIAAPDAKQIFGLQIVISTTAKSDKEGMALLKEMGMPFRKEKAEEKKVKKPEAPKPEVKKESEEVEEEKVEEKVESEAENTDTAETPESDTPTES